MEIVPVREIPSSSRSFDFNRPPLHPKPMARLALGAVRPCGWLKGQLDLLCDGTVGHLDELSPFLDSALLSFPYIPPVYPNPPEDY